MQKTAVRLVQPSSHTLLARLLDAPDLPAKIQELPADALGRLIDRIGLEDAGEIVALATTEQIAHVFDEDLWKNDQPGEEERFDVERFDVWLSVMLEAGDAYAAKRLSELPEDLVTLALHRQVLVLDVEALAAEMNVEEEDAAEQLDKALSNYLYEELDTYQLVARREEGWDNVLSVVLALDRDHHGFLVRVLDRCVRMSAEHIEDNGGLYEVLTSDEMLAADVAGGREDRRAEAGYVAPTAAASFLALARTDESVPLTEHDAVTRAYFRQLDEGRSAKKPASWVSRFEAKKLASKNATEKEAAAEESLRALLVDEEAPRTAPKRLVHGTAELADEQLFTQAMQMLADKDASRFEERKEELAYLLNVLVAGGSFEGRRFRPVEAAQTVLSVCSLGLSLLLGEPQNGDIGARSTGDALAQAVRILRDHPADGLFRRGYRDLAKRRQV